jgi:hypothetical protein
MVFVDTTHGRSIGSYSDAVSEATTHLITGNDALLVVAVDDRQANIGTGADWLRASLGGSLDFLFGGCLTSGSTSSRWTGLHTTPNRFGNGSSDDLSELILACTTCWRIWHSPR